MSLIGGLVFLGVGFYTIIGSIIEWVRNVNQHNERLQKKTSEYYQRCEKCGGEKTFIKHTFSEGFIKDNYGAIVGKTEIQKPSIITEYYFECNNCKSRFKSPIDGEINETTIDNIKAHGGDISYTKLSISDFQKKMGERIDFDVNGITGCRQPFFILLGLISVGIGALFLGFFK